MNLLGKLLFSLDHGHSGGLNIREAKPVVRLSDFRRIDNDIGDGQLRYRGDIHTFLILFDHHIKLARHASLTLRKQAGGFPE